MIPANFQALAHSCSALRRAGLSRGLQPGLGPIGWLCLAIPLASGCGGTETAGRGGADGGPADSSATSDGTHTTRDASPETSGDAAVSDVTSARDAVLSDVTSDASVCRSGEVLVLTTGCSPVGPPMCGDGGTLKGDCCSYSGCEPLPAGCMGTVSCACARTLCPKNYMCGVDMTNPDTLTCGFFPP
jgi:hypothetical protein